MDWGSVIIAISGIVGGSGITGFFFWRAKKREAHAKALQAEAEASKTEADTGSTVVDSMEKVVEKLQEQEDKYLAIIETKDEKIEELTKDKSSVMEEATTSQFLMCVNLGCVLRKPVAGRGKSWYDTNKDDPSLGANYLPVNRLLQMYGKNKDETDMRKYMAGRVVNLECETIKDESDDNNA